jgi:hypothetical protein
MAVHGDVGLAATEFTMNENLHFTDGGRRLHKYVVGASGLVSCTEPVAAKSPAARLTPREIFRALQRF